jgi:radical SAM superfamily enzyme YgiQ (UPF0313 family)
MKILCFKIAEMITEENRFGHRPWLEMPSNMVLTVHYLREQGFDVDIAIESFFDDEQFAPYDVVVEWISVADGLYEGLDYLRVAKRQGKTTVQVLFDDWEGLQRQILLDYPFVDYGIRRWDVEISLGNLLSVLRDGGTLAKTAGIVLREGEEVRDGGSVLHRPDDLLHLRSSRKEIEEINPKRFTKFDVRASSGCPFKCTFCHLRARTNRYRRIEDVVDELEALPRGAEVKLMSADLLREGVWVKAFCEKIIERKLEIEWDTDVRFNWLTDLDLLKLMRRAGCTKLALGLESYHPSIIKAVKKGYQMDQIDAGLANLKKAGIIPLLNMMIGHPKDDEETLTVTMDFISAMRENGYELAGIQFLRPLPGTPVEREALELGLLERPLNYRDFVFARQAPVMPTLKLSKSEIVDWHRRMAVAYDLGKSIPAAPH